MRKILSIDGGGIRGIIPAYQLLKLEEKLDGRIVDHFDLIAGTSTGAILAAGLGAGFSAKELYNLYVLEGPEIFKKNVLRSTWNWAIGSKYSDDSIESKLETYYGDRRLKDLDCDFLAVTYNMSKDRPRFFSSSQEGDYSLLDVVLASSAAPTYFNPRIIDGDSYIDGGVVSNNPSMCAYSEARNLYKINAEEMFILSLGTGTYYDSYKGMRKWFKFKWINPLIELMMGADSGVVHYQLSQIYKSIDRNENYYRITGVLPKWAKLKMDSTKPKDIRTLVEVAENIYNKNKYKFDKIVTILNKL